MISSDLFFEFFNKIEYTKINFAPASFLSKLYPRDAVKLLARQLKGELKDFVDDISLPDWDNYLIRHAKARQKIYKEQKFKYDIKNVTFEGDI